MNCKNNKTARDIVIDLINRRVLSGAEAYTLIEAIINTTYQNWNRWSLTTTPVEYKPYTQTTNIPDYSWQDYTSTNISATTSAVNQY